MEIMNDNTQCGDEKSGFRINCAACDLKNNAVRAGPARLKQAWPYAVVPFICAALFFVRRGGTDAYILLNLELIVIIGYVAALSDLRTMRIPNNLILVMLMVWTLIITPKLFMDTSEAVMIFMNSVTGFAAGGGIFLIVYLASGKTLGGGDVKFMAAAGVYLGFGGTISAVLLGSILASLTGLTLVLLKKMGRKDMMPLIPFLYIGILITVFLSK